MTAFALSAASRDPFMPAPPKGRGLALGLALFAHALLIIAIAFSVDWRNSEPTTLAAELWSAVPQAAAPRAYEPPPAPTPEVKAPVKRDEPVPPPVPKAALPDAQIAIEKAKREDAKREKAEQERKDKLAKLKLEKDKAEKAKAEKAKADKARTEQAQRDQADKDKLAKADAARQAAARDAYLKRIAGMANATGGATDTGTALHASGPSASYAGRIMARIKPNIVFTDPIDGNPIATVEVKLAPDGTIIAKRLLKSSGSKAWDDAVLRAIERTEILPRDIDGSVPPPFPITFRPRDL